MRFTIGRKLTAGFSLVFVLMLLIFGLSVYGLWALNARLNRLVDISTKAMMLSHSIIHEVMLEINRAKNNVLLSRSPAEMERYAADLDNLQSQYYVRMGELYNLADPEARDHLNESKNYFDAYLDNSHQVVELAKAGRLEEARHLSVEKGRPIMDKVHAIMHAVIRGYETAMQQEKQASNRKYLEAVCFLSLFLAVAMGSGVLTATVITRGIVRRMEKISEKAGEIASGKLDPANGAAAKDEDQDELHPAFAALTEIARSFAGITQQAKQITGGDLTVSIEPRGRDDELALTLQEMTRSLREARESSERDFWFKSGQNGLNEAMRGEREIRELAESIVAYLAGYLGAQLGSLYVADEGAGELRLCGSYAADPRMVPELPPVCRIGGGLAGQAAQQKTMLSLRDIPPDYLRITSTLGEALPRQVLVSPMLVNGEVKAVVELASLEQFSTQQLEFLAAVSESAASAIHAAQARGRVNTLLAETQRQATELQAQQEELQQINEELQQQTVELMASEERLKSQQAALEAVNAELEENAAQLEEQRTEILRKNVALETARQETEQKSRYKSQFLSNMSHELRTPLNTLLILAQDLSENRHKNLNEDQLESARLIYKSGVDLLELINEILDLAKVEAGKLSLNPVDVALAELAEIIETSSRPVAEHKGLELRIAVEQGAPAEIRTDYRRLIQVIKNLVSNAIKFTETGGVTVRIHPPGPTADLSRSGLDPGRSFGISVIDTGIGIPAEKQLEIFEAFQQADGTISRKYGGTGLGLSIARELISLLGGEIQLQSEPGKGSAFTVFLPVMISEGEAEGSTLSQPPAPPRQKTGAKGERASLDRGSMVPDDRQGLSKADRAILVIEDDPGFAGVLMKQCHAHGFQCLLAGRGEEGLDVAAHYLPAAIILDLHLPGMDGWQVLSALKGEVSLRHIPVHIISVEEVTVDAFCKGAMGFLSKPVTQQDLDQAFRHIAEVLEKKVKDLLLVEDDETQCRLIAQTIGNHDVQVTIAASGRAAIECLRAKRYDCLVLDLGLPDMSGFQLLNELDRLKDVCLPPTIVYTGRELSREDEAALTRYAESIIIKGVKSQERLLDETALFLHRVVSDLPEQKQRIITDLYKRDEVFTGKKVLLVDDDMRNIFVLSKILREKGLTVLKAEHGQAALEVLESEQVHAVLMDIMMPVMDGFEAIARIRGDERFRTLPIIAQTAKAMKEDRERVMAAGANDYIEKPINVERLTSMLRVWL